MQGLSLGAASGAVLMVLIGLVFFLLIRRYKRMYKSKMVPGEVFSKSKRSDGIDIKGYIHLGMWWCVQISCISARICTLLL